MIDFFGTPEWTRTTDLLLRRQTPGMSSLQTKHDSASSLGESAANRAHFVGVFVGVAAIEVHALLSRPPAALAPAEIPHSALLHHKGLPEGIAARRTQTLSWAGRLSPARMFLSFSIAWPLLLVLRRSRLSLDLAARLVHVTRSRPVLSGTASTL